MPTYDYVCENCQHRLEAFQKITDTPLESCPQCGISGLRRGVGGGNATFCFKGSGFYITDYAKTSSSQPGCPCKGSPTCE